MTLSIIAAVGSNRAIGRDNELLWNLPGDLPRFKRLTMGHPVIMGRRTFESIGRPLPGRLNLVVTRNMAYAAEGIEICHSLEVAVQRAEAAQPHDGETFVIGGGELYAQALALTDKLYLTEVEDAPADADTFFPDYSDFSTIAAQDIRIHNELTYRFVDRTRPQGNLGRVDLS